MRLTTALQRTGIRLTVVGIGLMAALALAHAQGYYPGYKYPGRPYYKGPGGGPYSKDPWGSNKAPPVGDPNDRGEMVPFRRGGGPLLAVVSLDAQRVAIYDGSGAMILQSPVSTSGEAQGGIKVRRRDPMPSYGNYGKWSPFGGGFFSK